MLIVNFLTIFRLWKTGFFDREKLLTIFCLWKTGHLSRRLPLRMLQHQQRAQEEGFGARLRLRPEDPGAVLPAQPRLGEALGIPRRAPEAAGRFAPVGVPHGRRVSPQPATSLGATTRRRRRLVGKRSGTAKAAASKWAATASSTEQQSFLRPESLHRPSCGDAKENC